MEKELGAGNCRGWEGRDGFSGRGSELSLFCLQCNCPTQQSVSPYWCGYDWCRSIPLPSALSTHNRQFPNCSTKDPVKTIGPLTDSSQPSWGQCCCELFSTTPQMFPSYHNKISCVSSNQLSELVELDWYFCLTQKRDCWCWCWSAAGALLPLACREGAQRGHLTMALHYWGTLILFSYSCEGIKMGNVETGHFFTNVSISKLYF